MNDDMTDPDPDLDPNAVSRRTVLDHAVKLGGLLWVAGMAVPAATYLLPAHERGPTESMVKVGPLSELPVGGAKMVHSRGQPIIVVRSAPDRIKAFSAICTHLGCVVQWDAPQKQIACPCHAARFSPEGQVVAGPPPRPLQEYQVVIVSDEIRVKVG